MDSLLHTPRPTRGLLRAARASFGAAMSREWVELRWDFQTAIGPVPSSRLDAAMSDLDALDGAKIRYHAVYAAPGSERIYRNYRLKCGACADNPACGKVKRADYTIGLGDIGPLAFLQAWQTMDWRAGGYATHALANPSDAVVQEYARTRDAELRAVFARLQ